MGMAKKNTKSKEVKASKNKPKKNSLKVKEEKKASTKSPAKRKSAPVRNKAPKKKLVAKKPKTKISAKEKATKFYESTVLDHRENGRKLSRSILRRWRVHMPLEEVDSIVDLALCEAAQRFSPKKGASFMTFFFYHLRGHLVRAVARATQINNFQATLEGDLENETDTSNFAHYVHLVDQELYSQKEQETPEDLVLRREKIGVCRNALENLDNLEKVVLERSYSDDEALVDIASSLGYSRCHISRVKKAAMIKLKSNLTSTAHFANKETKVIEDEEASIQHSRPIRRKVIPLTKKLRSLADERKGSSSFRVG